MSRTEHVPPATSAASDDAVGRIHDDLARTKRRRAFAMVLVLLAIGLGLATLALTEPPETALPRNRNWNIAMALFFTASAVATSLTLGLPLWRRTVTFALTFGASIAVVAGLALILDADAPLQTSFSAGLPCLGSGTAVATVAFITTALLTGRLWRRMADLSWIAAVGASAIGLALLTARCGGSDPVHVFGFHLPVVLALFVVAKVALNLRKEA